MRGALHADVTDTDAVPDTQREPNVSPKPPRVPPVGLAVLVLAACGAAAAERSTAEATYLAQQLACVDDNPNKWAIDACRDAVKQAWANGDAGADGDR